MPNIEIVLKHKIPNTRLLWSDGDNYIGAQGRRLVTVKRDGSIESLDVVPSRYLETLLAKNTILRLGLRLGVHNILRWKDYLVVSIKRKILLYDCRVGEWSVLCNVTVGNKPAYGGMCIDGDDHLCWAEYAVNLNRRYPISAYMHKDSVMGQQVMMHFNAGDIRHIHFVSWDYIAGCHWIGTGDSDNECRLYRSDDRGVSWDLVGSGSQMWRAVNMVFTNEYIYWGTDGGYDSRAFVNQVVRFDRVTKQIQSMCDLPGPCHGITNTPSGMFLSTGVEGGINEIDRYAHLFHSKDGIHWSDVMRAKKNLWPRDMQFGVYHFVHGTQPHNVLALTALGLEPQSEYALICEVK